MSPLRKKRLLMLATKPANHKRFYSEYCILMQEGLVYWTLGTAFLSIAGEKELESLIMEKNNVRQAEKVQATI